MESPHPKLRPVHPQPAIMRGRRVFLLQDPLRLSNKSVFIPVELAPLLAFCDGTRPLEGIRASLMIRAGINLSLAELEQILVTLDDALLLDNANSQDAIRAALAEFRSAPFRPPTLAGNGYPAVENKLRVELDAYIHTIFGTEPVKQTIRGLVSPHIDYQRGGPVYAEVWSRAATAARQAELVVILGTDHNGNYGQVTLTKQSYATPYGVLPTDVELMDAIAGAIGEETAYAEELHHRFEHSIELAATWLHHIRKGKPCKLAPILLGSFSHFIHGEDGEPSQDTRYNRTIDVLKEAVNNKVALIVSAGDLAHIGPAFDGNPVDMMGKTLLKVNDDVLIDAICTGDAEAVFQNIRAEKDSRNVCGLPPIYMAMRVLGETHGTLTGYDRCPADTNDTSFVSICGVIWE